MNCMNSHTLVNTKSQLDFCIGDDVIDWIKTLNGFCELQHHTETESYYNIILLRYTASTKTVIIHPLFTS